MFLCFFALSSNMTANLYEQTKEVGVLRAIGITKCRVKMLYFYEAMILVLASCLLGVMVGMIVGYTMTL
jgi:ABC-type lipoprotein release transport system permease subunit